MTHKKRRRTKAEIELLKETIYVLAERYQPMSVRQLFYRLVVEGAVEKTQATYKNTVVRLVSEMRLNNELPWRWITDSTRLMRKPDSYNSLASMLESSQRFYRRDIWHNQDVYVEIWCESDSAAGTLIDATWEWDVPLMSARGFSSLTFLHSAARTIGLQTRNAQIYYFGDRDPSGVHIDLNIVKRLYSFISGADDVKWIDDEYRDGIFECPGFTFQRVAVTERQVVELDLPSTPAKKTDARSVNFDGEAVELEAIDPNELRRMCEACITQNIDANRLEASQTVEAAEKETLSTIVQSLSN